MTGSNNSTNKQRIMDASVHLFANKGFDAVSVREIAEAAAVTKPVIYYYFENKLALYDAIIDDSLQAGADMHESIYNADLSSDEQLRQIMRAHFRYAKKHPDKIRMMHDALSGHSNPEHAHKYRKKIQSNFRTISDFIIKGQEKNQFTPDVAPEHVALLFIGGMNLFVMKELQDAGSQLSDAAADQLVDIIVHGIVRR